MPVGQAVMATMRVTLSEEPAVVAVAAEDEPLEAAAEPVPAVPAAGAADSAAGFFFGFSASVSYTHLRAHET